MSATSASDAAGPRSAAAAAVLTPNALALASFGLAAFHPLAALLAGPLLLGVPHLLGDLRVLVLDGAWRGRRADLALVAAALGGMLVARVAGLLSGAVQLELELTLGIAAVAAGLHTAVRAGFPRVAALALFLALTAPFAAAPQHSLLVLGHLHNVVAVVWCCAALRDTRARWTLGALWLAAQAVIFVGAIELPLDASLLGLSARDLAERLAPSLGDVWAARWLSSFAFAQLFHYAAWIVVLPRLAGRRLFGEADSLGFALSVGACLALPAAALFDAAAARELYIGAVSFHAWLELAVLAALLGRRRL
ncbi:MAG: hypothetical protein JNN27_08600 [Planctomycetes bacterium]|nr:hypothetical protein [Planctomycetota bacterium]